MPTTHVGPESQEALQDIANGLLKARKVVVVTGAGISTNSGIPVSFFRKRPRSSQLEIGALASIAGPDDRIANSSRISAPRMAFTR
jgi:hypothetical protein